MPNETHEPGYLTLTEFAERIERDPKYVRRNLRLIPGAKLSTDGIARWLIPVSAVDDYFNNGCEFRDGEWLRPSEVAVMIGYADVTVKKMAKAGVFEHHIKYTGQRGHIRIKRSSVEEWMRGHREDQ